MEDDPNSTINIYIIGLTIGLVVGIVLIFVVWLFVGLSNTSSSSNSTTENSTNNTSTTSSGYANEEHAELESDIADSNMDSYYDSLSATEDWDTYNEVTSGESCDIKGNISYNTGEKIYHVPGQSYYAATEINTSYGEKWFCSEQEAQAAGWRKAYQ